MIKILLDQGLPRSAAGLLRQQGWDALHVGDVGLATASDQTILMHAIPSEQKATAVAGLARLGDAGGAAPVG